MIAVETVDASGARRLYLTHREWIPELDAISAARVREVWAQDSYDSYELARMFCTSHRTITDCVQGEGAYRHLPPVAKGAAIIARGFNPPTVYPRTYDRAAVNETAEPRVPRFLLAARGEH